MDVSSSTRSSARTRSPLATAVALNNQGGMLLSRQLQGDILDGGRCFEAALRILKEQVHVLGTRKYRKPNKSCPSLLPTHVKAFPKTVAVSRTTAATIEQRDRATPSQELPQRSSQRSKSTNPSPSLSLLTYYLHLRPFKLSGKLLIDKDILVKPSLLTTVITFNLALSHHLMGYTVAPGKRERSWRAASRLYRLAKSLRIHQIKFKTKETPLQRNLVALLDLAIDNNTAVLHSELGDSQRALGSFRSLSGRIQQLEVVHHRQQGVLQGFVGNLALVGIICDKTASAA